MSALVWATSGRPYHQCTRRLTGACSERAIRVSAFYVYGIGGSLMRGVRHHMTLHRRFDCYSNDVLVGWSELKYTDPPMGVAFGTFVPAPGYQTIQQRVRAANCEPRDYLAMEALALTVRNVAGQTLQCAGVWLTDVADLGEEPQLEILGAVEFDENFPGETNAYLSRP